MEEGVSTGENCKFEIFSRQKERDEPDLKIGKLKPNGFFFK
jgi:hypothetical protein